MAMILVGTVALIAAVFVIIHLAFEPAAQRSQSFDEIKHTMHQPLWKITNYELRGWALIMVICSLVLIVVGGTIVY